METKAHTAEFDCFFTTRRHEPYTRMVTPPMLYTRYRITSKTRHGGGREGADTLNSHVVHPLVARALCSFRHVHTLDHQDDQSQVRW